MYKEDLSNYNDDDQFDDNDFEVIPNMHESYSVSSYQQSINSKKKSDKKLLEDYKMQDKGYRKYIQYNNGKKVEVDAYSTSSTPGVFIRDAITGSKDSRYKVGSLDENLFFKIKMAIGHVGFEKDENKSETILFYDNPEQFERHMRTTLSTEIKETWQSKYTKQLAKYQ
jgi:hypothetical protein